jgi:hypothetical protein
MDKSGLEALLASLDHWAALFIAFVAIGVAGELVVHLLYSRASGRLIALQHTEEQTLHTEITRLGSIIAEANKAAAQANERANQMEVQAEELRRQNLEIQRKINPRFLTRTEQQIIFDTIRPFRGHQIILTRLGDGEAGPNGDSFIEVFQRAGWAVQVNHIGMFMPPTLRSYLPSISSSRRCCQRGDNCFRKSEDRASSSTRTRSPRRFVDRCVHRSQANHLELFLRNYRGQKFKTDPLPLFRNVGRTE